MPLPRVRSIVDNARFFFGLPFGLPDCPLTHGIAYLLFYSVTGTLTLSLPTPLASCPAELQGAGIGALHLYPSPLVAYDAAPKAFHRFITPSNINPAILIPQSPTLGTILNIWVVTGAFALRAYHPTIYFFPSTNFSTAIAPHYF